MSAYDFHAANNLDNYTCEPEYFVTYDMDTLSQCSPDCCSQCA